MQNVLGDHSVNFPIAFYKIGTFVKWNNIEEGRSYGGGGEHIYIYREIDRNLWKMIN